ncbi:ACT domain-containing protein [Lacunisphaera limnophila]|uniref:ACT domain-containing protein n=1 Tax=Lacunisphaera limnophila TaxID=1838286 RepID=UPI0008598535
MESLVLTIIAADRPGLVDRLAACVADHGGNWLESRMCHLGGRFAGIARVEVAAEKLTALKRALHGLEADGLRIVVESGAHSTGSGQAASTGSGQAGAAGGVAVTIELVGNDRPGILRTVTGVLAAHGVNVEELSSECVSAPMGGGDLFQAKARVLVPAGVKLEAVRADLEKIATDLMVDLKLRPVG